MGAALCDLHSMLLPLTAWLLGSFVLPLKTSDCRLSVHFLSLIV